MLQIKTNKQQINALIFAVITTWYLLPIVNSRINTIGVVLLYGAWMLTSNIRLLLKAFVRWGCFLLWYFYMLLMLVLGFFDASGITPIYFYTMTFMFALPALVFCYYQDTLSFGIISLLTRLITVIYIVGSVTTIVVIRTYPTAAKLLAMSDTATGEKSFLLSLGCGGYGYIYSIVLMYLPLLFAREKNRFWRLVRYAAAGCNIYAMVLSQYTLALFISILCIAAYYFFSRMNGSRISVIVSMLLFLIILMVLFNLTAILDNLAVALQEQAGLSNRLQEVSNFLKTGEQGYNLNGRTVLYGRSWSVFLRNPLFGTQLNTQQLVGGHSSLLDQLARYGLIGTISYAAFVLSMYRFCRCKSKILFFSYIAFFLLSLLNTTIYVYQLGMVLFWVIPIFVLNEELGE